MHLRTAILTGFFAVGLPSLWEQPLPFLPSPRLSAGEASSALVPDPRDVQVLEEKIEVAATYPTLPARTLAVAQSFKGAPYVHGILEQSGGSEQLVVNLRQLDCWTFLENSLAIALTARAAEPAFDTLQQYLRQLRYWGGTVNGYASRIHYFSAWLLQAEKLGYLQDLTPSLGGVPYRKQVGYLSARPHKYPPLRDPETRRRMYAVEDRINRHPWHFIPLRDVARVEHLLRDGDIIALTSGKRDLDIAHQGFAVCRNGHVYLLHASSLAHKVVLSAQPLPQFLRSQKGRTGIMVARLKD